MEGATNNILIVDDTLENLQVLSGMLRDSGYKARPVPSGHLAIQAAMAEPPDLILLDIMMPEMNGYEVCEKLKSTPELQEIPVIFMSALTETLDKVKAFKAGGVDYITKPFQYEEVKARVETHLSIHSMRRDLEKYNKYLEQVVQEKVKEITEHQMATIFALAKLAESRDDDTGKHLERVQSLCELLAKCLKEDSIYSQGISDSFIKNIYYASPLHDIGKVGIPDSVLLKPGKLTPEEFVIMKTHAAIGANTLEAVKGRFPNNSFIETGIEIAHYHHENWNGTGYPSGLSGTAIPLSARIMKLTDVYDALRSKRVYKPALPHEEAKKIILQGEGTQFDPEIIRVFSTHDKLFEQAFNNMVD